MAAPKYKLGKKKTQPNIRNCTFEFAAEKEKNEILKIIQNRIILTIQQECHSYIATYGI